MKTFALTSMIRSIADHDVSVMFAPAHVLGRQTTKSMSLRAMSGLNMITALQHVEGRSATGFNEGKCWGPSVTCTWKPPCHSMVQLPTLTAVVPAPPWYNNVNSGAIKMSAKVQANATCGLHAVNHLLACSPCPRVLHKDEFEQCGLRAGIGDSAEKLLESRTGSYKVAVLQANLGARNLSLFAMTAADIESRFDEPFCQHVMPTGIHKVVGYLVRVPLHGGHWITLLPGRVVWLPVASSAEAVLCDSMHPQPFLLSQEETKQLLQACASDAATAECHSTTGFVCFLVAAAEPCARWQMLFQVSYADGQYATELARLCTAYGVTGASSANYMVQGWFGKQFRLLFYDQPQLAPDAEWFDFPLTVCLAQQGHAGPGACETGKNCSDWPSRSARGQ